MNKKNIIIIIVGLITLIILAIVNEYFRRSLVIPFDYYRIFYFITLIFVTLFLYRYSKNTGKDKIFLKWLLVFLLLATLIYFCLTLV
jgi:uncharacterized membrane protein